MQRIQILVAELLLVAAAVFTADTLQNVIDFIPRWLIHLPAAAYSAVDFRTVLMFFLAVHAVVLVANSLICGPWSPRDAKRTIDEGFALAVGFAVSALLIFVTTTVSFDPQFVVGIVVCSEVMLLVVYVIARVLGGISLGKIIGDYLKAFLRRSCSVAGVLIFVIALSPGILAKLFVSDRDVANVITQIRINVASVKSHDWGFVNALDGQTFAQPLLVRFAPNDAKTVYVLERIGRIVRMPWGAGGTPEVVIDLRHRVGYVEVENGAIGFTFHPNFGQSGKIGHDHLYLYYTSVHDEKQINYLSRFSLAGDTAEARAASEYALITWDRPDDGFHNGGSIEFGEDGFLYLAVGEMSMRDSQQSISQDLTSGVLRIDVDKRGEPISRPIARQPANGTTRDYFIPTDNPFADVPEALGEYWALGLRNPFRMSFDTKTGDLWVGDVGSTVWEEVNLIRKGHNYEFPFREGRADTDSQRPDDLIGELTGPIYTYQHTAYDRAVIGGVVYRGDKYPELVGQYIFGDNYSGKIFAIPATPEDVQEAREIAQANQFAQRGIASFAISPNGRILVTTLGKASVPSGEVLMLVRESEADATIPKATSSATEVVSVDEVKVLFTTNCGRCHGGAGKADGPDAEHLKVHIADMTAADFLDKRDSAHLRKVIRDGGAASGLSPLMPPWGMLFSEAELTALVEYVQSLSQN